MFHLSKRCFNRLMEVIPNCQKGGAPSEAKQKCPRVPCPLWVISGHLQRKGMSALPPKRTCAVELGNVRFVPKADIVKISLLGLLLPRPRARHELHAPKLYDVFAGSRAPVPMVLAEDHELNTP